MSGRDQVAMLRDDPLVTIAIPTFNRAPLLKECVAAALAQTYEQIEVLVSDNASTDETRQVMTEFADNRLRIVRQQTNIGMLPNWNACLAEARGDYIIFVPDDDRPAPWLVRKCVELVRRQPDIPIVITLSDLYAASFGTVGAARTSGSIATGIVEGTEILSEFLMDRITVTMCGIMMRVDMLRTSGGIPGYYGHTADLAAWVPMLFLGKAGFVNEACATFRFHSDSQTSRLAVEEILHDGRKIDELIARLIAEHVSDPAKRQIIQGEASRCFARRGLLTLSDYRNNGGGLQRILNIVWEFRRDLGRVNAAAGLRFAAIVACPRRFAGLLRWLKHRALERPAWP